VGVAVWGSPAAGLLVGRDAELAVLDSLVAAAAGSGGVVLLGRSLLLAGRVDEVRACFEAAAAEAHRVGDGVTLVACALAVGTRSPR
jgi:hypothetical protein